MARSTASSTSRSEIRLALDWNCGVGPLAAEAQLAVLSFEVLDLLAELPDKNITLLEMSLEFTGFPFAQVNHPTEGTCSRIW